MPKLVRPLEDLRKLLTEVLVEFTMSCETIPSRPTALTALLNLSSICYYHCLECNMQ